MYKIWTGRWENRRGERVELWHDIQEKGTGDGPGVSFVLLHIRGHGVMVGELRGAESRLIHIVHSKLDVFFFFLHLVLAPGATFS